MSRFVRAALAEDAPRIAHIYNEGIAERSATFETEPRTPAAIADWLKAGYPVVVAGESHVVLAFAAAFPYRARDCYAGVREFSVYAAAEGRGQGFARLAMDELIAEAVRRDWWKLVSRVFPENGASRALLARLGFREVGIYHKHARLDGVWRDVVIVEKLIA
jgi:phosphinothricin acetyltransferase